MRPVPSHDLPVLDLIEPKDKRYDPKPEDLSPRALRERLDRDFDKQFMSETRPLESILHPNGTVEFSFKRTKRGKLVPSSKMPKEIRHLRLHALKLPDGSRFRMKVGKKMRRKFKQMLWAYTYCPVAYRWKDLGLRFWPRWIKEGSCLTLGSCSLSQRHVLQAPPVRAQDGAAVALPGLGEEEALQVDTGQHPHHHRVQLQLLRFLFAPTHPRSVTMLSRVLGREHTREKCDFVFICGASCCPEWNSAALCHSQDSKDVCFRQR
ncbi:hypothetical protein CEXT_625661 [Caerostris extrusa]|uniref:Noggin n=1 Tax=Caerostris extrusa TaxID=172846 RepID=A0AAV4XJV1_CAEEX|nr:hypothetical protein CEXT_625661 [Caerostris extrusa]